MQKSTTEVAFEWLTKEIAEVREDNQKLRDKVEEMEATVNQLQQRAPKGEDEEGSAGKTKQLEKPTVFNEVRGPLVYIASPDTVDKYTRGVKTMRMMNSLFNIVGESGIKFKVVHENKVCDVRPNDVLIGVKFYFAPSFSTGTIFPEFPKGSVVRREYRQFVVGMITKDHFTPFFGMEGTTDGDSVMIVKGHDRMFNMVGQLEDTIGPKLVRMVAMKSRTESMDDEADDFGFVE